MWNRDVAQQFYRTHLTAHLIGPVRVFSTYRYSDRCHFVAFLVTNHLIEKDVCPVCHVRSEDITPRAISRIEQIELGVCIVASLLSGLPSLQEFSVETPIGM